MKATATAKYIGTSSRKISLVAALIRGKSVISAQSILEHTGKRATEPVGKVLASALANAQNNDNAKKGDLIVESVLVGPAPTLKRFRARAKGAAASIRKRSSHITVVLSDNKVATTKPMSLSKGLAKSTDASPKLPVKPSAASKTAEETT